MRGLPGRIAKLETALHLAAMQAMLAEAGAVEAVALIRAVRAKKNPEPPPFETLWAALPEQLQSAVRDELLAGAADERLKAGPRSKGRTGCG